MTDPKIVTDADTVARLHAAAIAIRDALGDDNIVLIEPTGDAPMVACVAEHNPGGSLVAVAIETGHVWHYDPDTDTGTPAPKAADATVDVDVHDTSGRDHFTDEGSCFCLKACCNDDVDDNICTCRWGCTDIGHVHG